MNPSSVHSAGQRGRAIIEQAREKLGALLKLSKGDRVVFTSGATEANNAAVYSPFLEHLPTIKEKELNLVTTAIEHLSVLEPCQRLAQYGCGVRIVSPINGSIYPESIVEACDANTQLVSVMFANNETGAVLPVANIATAVKAKFPKILVHSDAVQALGKIPFSFDELGVDLLTLSGHKIGALSGVGALVIRSGVTIPALLLGGPQESRLRAGTENLIGIYSLGLACSLLLTDLSFRIEKMKSEKAQILDALVAAFPNLTLNSPADSLPNTLNLTFPGINADDLVVALDQEKVLISSGAACSSGKPEPSHVLLASGLSKNQAKQTIRISIPAELTRNDLDYALHSLKKCIGRFA